MRKFAFLVRVLGYWGRGKTLKEAACNCAKAGGKKNDRAVVNLILGDNEPSVNGNGDILRAMCTENMDIGQGFRLGQLLKLED